MDTWSRVIMNTIDFCYAVLSALAMRWLLKLARWQDDILWMQAQWSKLEVLHWYRGFEVIHQIRARAIWDIM